MRLGGHVSKIRYYAFSTLDPPCSITLIYMKNIEHREILMFLK